MTKAEIIEVCRALFESSPPIGFEEIAYKPYPGTDSHDIATALHGKNFDEIVALLKTDEVYGLWAMWTFFTPEGFRHYLPAFMAAGMEGTEESVHVRSGMRGVLAYVSRSIGRDASTRLDALDRVRCRLAVEYLDFTRHAFSYEIRNETERDELRQSIRRLLCRAVVDVGSLEWVTKEQLLFECREVWKHATLPAYERTTKGLYPRSESEDIAQLLHGKSFDEILNVLRSDVAYETCCLLWTYVTPEAYRACLPVFVAASLDGDDPAVHMRDSLLRNVLPGRHEHFEALGPESRRLMTRFLQFVLRQYPDEAFTEEEMVELTSSLDLLLRADS